ncbi:MAG: hypothetical protein J0I84_03350 [Terrimonas sp.]|uniref:hypothetical protein n=1 Tax=Terrimonas sp. TaxID=1914338 RepID=UPI000928C2D1|nr:hypothetical protein [Terrimonas sp.]MBN8786097.1 hypothetical protein [Terrimonas sp.]OJY88275.1 MAG: hypothetical protein BGP13_07010 [Sphingobacteriales bacterium 40-81]PVD51172.1 hypothetical protein DC498_16105 [Terrimonas sp.]
MDKKNKTQKDLPGYPKYPASEDIYENGSKLRNDFDDENESMEMGLDVPGADLDDEDEKIGSEDEENNYYSLGGDNHEDLEESNPDDV